MHPQHLAHRPGRGRPPGPAARGAGSGRGRAAAARLRGAPAARAARAGRQGADRLERPHDLGPGRGPPRAAASPATWKRPNAPPASSSRPCARPTDGCCAPGAPGTRTSRAYLEDYAYLADALLDLYEAGGRGALPARGGDAPGRSCAVISPTRRAASSPPPRDHEALIVRPSRRARRRHAQRERGGRAGPGPALLPPRPGGAARAGGRRAAGLGPRHLPPAARLRAEPVGRGPPARRAHRARVPGRDGGCRPARPPARGGPALSCPIASWPSTTRRGARRTCRCCAGKGLAGGRSALYVCRNFACASPVTDPEQVSAALSGPDASAAARSALARPALARPRHRGGHRPLRGATQGPKGTGPSAPRG